MLAVLRSSRLTLLFKSSGSSFPSHLPERDVAGKHHPVTRRLARREDILGQQILQGVLCC